MLSPTVATGGQRSTMANGIGEHQRRDHDQQRDQRERCRRAGRHQPGRPPGWSRWYGQPGRPGASGPSLSASAALRAGPRLRSRPSSSSDSNSGGEIRRPVTATRTGPNALRGLSPSPSTSAARSASSIAAVVHVDSAGERVVRRLHDRAPSSSAASSTSSGRARSRPRRRTGSPSMSTASESLLIRSCDQRHRRRRAARAARRVDRVGDQPGLLRNGSTRSVDLLDAAAAACARR